MKKCSSCNKYKELKDFNKNKARNDGVSVYCIVCEKNKRKIKQEQKIKKRLQEQFIENEIWKDIREFEGYEVSTEGRIRNKKTALLLTQTKNCSGYAVSSIRNKNIKFHKIVAENFLPNFYNKKTVEHIDDNKMNNKIYNLKWATHKEQQKYIIEKKSRKSYKNIPIGISNLKSLEGEEWKIITEFPEYQISSTGRIKYPIRKGKKPYKKRIAYGGKSGDGYKVFEFRNNEYKRKIALHRIIAITFIDNPNGYKIVNHKDGNKTNNSIENLEWCSRSQNTQHAYDNNLISGKREIYQLDKNNKIIKKWNTIKEAHQTLKLSRTSINAVLSGRNKTAGGFFWCYKENYDSNKKNHTLYDTNKKKVVQVDMKTNNIIKVWNNISEAANYISNENNCSEKSLKSNISQCIRGKRNSCYGFKWEYFSPI